jgi:hypothetical protein
MLISPLIQDCPHVSETEQSFFALQTTVKNKNNLRASLEEFVKGEMLDGNNKYHCGQCDAKVSAVKRTCIKSLPPTLVISLKRMEFDMEQFIRVKVHDRCEFPIELDLYEFTVEGLAEQEAKAASSSAESPQSQDALPSSLGTKTADDSTKRGEKRQASLYRLSGIVIHLGTADAGHYYSYIQERNADGSVRGPWMEFNDTAVRSFDAESSMDRCAFGGLEHTPNGLAHRMYSAYLLLYERVVPDEKTLEKTAAPDLSATDGKKSEEASVQGNCPPSKSSASDMEAHKDTLQEVWRDNSQIYQEHFLSEPPTEHFLRNMLKSESSLSTDFFQTAASYFFDVLPVIPDLLETMEWQQLLLSAVGDDVERAAWLLGMVCEQNGLRLERSLFVPRSYPLGMTGSAILKHALTVCAKQSDAIPCEYRSVTLTMPDPQQVELEDVVDLLEDDDRHQSHQQDFRERQRHTLKSAENDALIQFSIAGSDFGSTYIVPNHPILLLFHRLVVDVAANMARYRYRDQLDVVADLMLAFAAHGKDEALVLSGSSYLSTLMQIYVAIFDPHRPDHCIPYKQPTPVPSLIATVNHCLRVVDRDCLNDHDDNCCLAGIGYMCVSDDFARCVTDMRIFSRSLRPLQFLETSLNLWSDIDRSVLLKELPDLLLHIALRSADSAKDGNFILTHTRFQCLSHLFTPF